MTLPLKRSALLIISLALFAAACGQKATSAKDGVASLTDESAEVAASSSDAPTETNEEAALTFAQCMRDSGIDFPDPTVDENGTPSFGDAFRSGSDGEFDPQSDEFGAALETCDALTADVTFGGHGGANMDPAILQVALLPYTDCLRDEGLDVGDFILGEGNALHGGGAPQSGTGTRASGGDNAERVAQVLGIDMDDPQVEAAMDVCDPYLGEGLAAAGHGG